MPRRAAAALFAAAAPAAAAEAAAPAAADECRRRAGELVRLLAGGARGTLPCPALPYVLAHAAELVPPRGLLLEFGVASGRTANLIAAALAPRAVHGFDSWLGLPENWNTHHRRGHFSAPRPPPVLRNVVLHPGWFNETLPRFLGEQKGAAAALVHVDCDLYSSTAEVLSALLAAGMLRVGTIVIFDELVGYPEYRDHEARALCELERAAPHLALDLVGGQAWTGLGYEEWQPLGPRPAAWRDDPTPCVPVLAEEQRDLSALWPHVKNVGAVAFRVSARGGSAAPPLRRSCAGASPRFRRLSVSLSVAARTRA